MNLVCKCCSKTIDREEDGFNSSSGWYHLSCLRTDRNETPAHSCLTRANGIINGPRRDAYGDCSLSFNKIAAGWSCYKGVAFTPKDVAMMMVIFKVCRESNKHHIDNIDDACGYLALAEKVKDLPAPLAHLYPEQHQTKSSGE